VGGLRRCDIELFCESLGEAVGYVTAYDAWYIAIAESLDAPLLTLDLRLASAPGLRCRIVTPSTR
jgi:predicted nucleic acid-binding protein